MVPKFEPFNSPVHSLPPEILSEIFLLSLEGPYHILGPLHDGPWLIGRVCHRWRVIVWGYSALWSSFVVGWPRPRQEDTGRRLLGEALRRTGQRGLSVKIWICDAFPDVITETLLQHSSQWEAVDLCGPAPNQWIQLSELGLHFPSLRLLAVNHTSSAELPAVLSMFKDAPNLKSLQINLHNPHPLSFHPAAIKFPWSRITDLKMSIEGRVGPSVEILRLCSNLEVLEESCGVFVPEAVTDPVPLTLRILRSLSVGSPLFLRYITCPALEHLSIAIPHRLPFSERDLSRFFVRSGSQLQTLKLGSLAQDISDPRQLFSCIPQLRKLFLGFQGCDYYGNLTRILTSIRSQDAGVMIPRLSVLELSVDEIFTGKIQLEGRDEILIGIIVERWDVPQESRVTRLNQVRISCEFMGFTDYMVTQQYEAARNRTLARVDRLKLFKTEGLDISIIAKQTNIEGPLEDHVLLA
ncbi:uncharacterized protein EV420DRAFT_1579512 [Desarmillaria tabescens]|uniref:F-box domain-containing protein n=1 Tax=Armillaria tabescens TaxID=1929756 RepID=A0AA39MQ85_ARMTA|nr:uncharacterized protein EV420DRAFT_1579512 [Desarmillaria tabescens]KAK0441785.1 hypothetical protein EV420DRAFT_1579512 [Desarmillaria tabescens]